MNTEAIRRFVSLEKVKKDLEAQLKLAASELADSKEAAIEALLAVGLAAVEVDGRRVELVQKAAARPTEDREAVIQALKASPAAGLVAENYDTKSLDSFVNEVLDHVRRRAKEENWDRLYTPQDVCDALPEPMRDVLKVSFFHVLSSRKAPTK
jgi:hypothetical protein